MAIFNNVFFFLQGLICLNGDIIRRDSIDQMPSGNAKYLMNSVFELAQRLNQFRLSDAEIGLFCAVVIISAGKSFDEKTNKKRSLKCSHFNFRFFIRSLQIAPASATPSSCRRCRDVSRRS